MNAQGEESTIQESVQIPVPAGPVVSKGKKKGDPLLRLGLIALVLFLGYKVVPFYYYYYDIKSNCAQVLRNAAVQSDEELRREWLEVIRGHGIEKESRDIGIQRIGDQVKMWLNYQEHLEVSLMGHSVILYSFDFTPSAKVGGEE